MVRNSPIRLDEAAPAFDVPRLDEPKLRILQVAEALFCDRAIDSVSLREIAQTAGHANTNAVQYHFGGRDELVQAIFAWRVFSMEATRSQRLVEAEASGKLGDLATLIEILCLPYLELVDGRGRHTYAGFLTQYLLRRRPLGIRHAADYPVATPLAIQRLLSLIYDRVGYLRHDNNDYRVGLASALFCNMLVLADAEDMPQRDPDGFGEHVTTALKMATAALNAAAN